MAEHDPDIIQAIVNFYPLFDGQDKTHYMENKDKLRVSLSLHWKSVPTILQGEPEPTTAQYRSDVDVRERERFQYFVLHDQAFGQQCRKNAHG